MCEVYSKANEVVAWLGNGKKEEGLLLKLYPKKDSDFKPKSSLAPSVSGVRSDILIFLFMRMS